MKRKFDIVIIGGGHAGLEAAWIAEQFNLDVAILTLEGVSLASAPCNPAVGGVGKGQVVREIDALGGVMGQLADLAGIQYRTLNDSKGYAVHSTRVQIDKEKYSSFAEDLVSQKTSIEVLRGRVERVSKENDLFEISYFSDKQILSKKVIVTTGTFLAGKLHTGEEICQGGRVSCQASAGINDIFKGISRLPLRFKTGTPARLKKSSLDFSKMEVQPSDPEARNFHWGNSPDERNLPQLDCYLTRTNESTLSIIRENKERSPIYNGQIEGVGPRYCPSIEDKAFRYPDRNGHHVFIEPEGVDLDTIYPNGISTSLPKEVQLDFIKTINGLEDAEIEVYGYAVEYDVVDTTELDFTLQYKNLPGLYFAGQVNGTSGYEEAAGQGLVAGANAALSLLGRDPLVLDRNESYIGVMIEDLIINKRDEPYRLFTARSENRLYVREDNVIERMAPYRQQFGLDFQIDNHQQQFMKEMELLTRIVHSYRYSSNDQNKQLFVQLGLAPLDQNLLMAELIKRGHLDPVKTLENELKRMGAAFNPSVVRTVAITTKYEGYINRANVENARLTRLGKKKLDWEKLVENKNISNECRQRIEKFKPHTFGQLQRLEGIRPATLAFVAGNYL